MTKGKNTSINLGDYWVEFAQEMVRLGKYGTVSEVARAGLRLLAERECWIGPSLELELPGPQPFPMMPRAVASAIATPSQAVWDAYSDAYQRRYGVTPVRNARVNGQLTQLLKRIPADEAPAVAAHYLRSNNAYYVAKGHPVGALLADAEKLCTEWRTGRQTTATAAQKADRTATRSADYQAAMERLRALDELDERKGRG